MQSLKNIERDVASETSTGAGVYNFGAYHKCDGRIPMDTRNTARGFIKQAPMVAGSMKYSAANLTR